MKSRTVTELRAKLRNHTTPVYSDIGSYFYVKRHTSKAAVLHDYSDYSNAKMNRQILQLYESS